MLRVLLVIDDYGELLYLQTLLKKLGFDVDGIQNERNFEESFLALNPDIVVANAKGVRVNGITLAENMRKVRGLPKVIILAPMALAEKLAGLQIANVDLVVESPVSASQILTSLAQLGQLDENSLLEKYRRLKASLSPEREADLQIIRREQEIENRAKSEAAAVAPHPAPAENDPNRITLAPSTLSESDRQERFKKSVATMEKTETDRFPHERIVEFHREIRASENREETAELEEERQSFVKALFKKAKGS